MLMHHKSMVGNKYRKISLNCLYVGEVALTRPTSSLLIDAWSDITCVLYKTTSYHVRHGNNVIMF